MGVKESSISKRRSDSSGLYMRALDKLLRETEDGVVMWSRQWEGVDASGVAAERTVYVADTPNGKLLLRGRDDGGVQRLSTLPLRDVAEPARRGEARLYLYTEDGRAGLFPPIQSSGLQPILDDLLTVVRRRVEGPQAEEFARRFLGEE